MCIHSETSVCSASEV